MSGGPLPVRTGQGPRLASGAQQRPRMLPNVLHCSGQPLPLRAVLLRGPAHLLAIRGAAGAAPGLPRAPGGEVSCRRRTGSSSQLWNISQRALVSPARHFTEGQQCRGPRPRPHFLEEDLSSDRFGDRSASGRT